MPEYSALSRASTMPPLLSKPFQRVQNSREYLIGESSVSKAPAFVSFPFSCFFEHHATYLADVPVTKEANQNKEKTA